jgi:hypothetical protein
MRAKLTLSRRIASLSTRRPADDAAVRSVQLGGVAIYASERVDLDALVEELGEVLCEASSRHLSLDRGSLRKVMSELVGTQVEDRIFGALLGRALRLGHIVSVPCLSEGSRVFRVHVAAPRLAEFESARSQLAKRAAETTIVSVTETERLILGQRRWGTWSSASHLLASAAERGQLVRLDKQLFRWPREVYSAVCSTP